MFDNYIVKGIGGFYYVKTGGSLVECKPKGIFRKSATRRCGRYRPSGNGRRRARHRGILPRKMCSSGPLWQM